MTGELAAKPEAGTLRGKYHVGVMKNVVETPMSQEDAEQLGIEYVPPPAGVRQEPKITSVVPKKYHREESSIPSLLTRRVMKKVEEDSELWFFRSVLGARE